MNMEYNDFFRQPYKRLMNLLVYVVCTTSIIDTFFVLRNTPNVEGIEMLFLLPFSYGICCFFFRDAFLYNKGGMALKVFFVVMFFRYVVMPFATCSIGHLSQRLFSPAAYRYSIFCEIVELIAGLWAIQKFYPTIFEKVSSKIKASNKYIYQDWSIGGLLVVLFSLFVIARRGISNFTMYLRFAMVTDELENAIYGYDVWMAQTLLAFLVITVTSYFQKRNDRKPSFFNFIIPLIVGMLSCMMAFGNNRMMIVYFALSAISILLFAFPSYKKGVFAFLVPAFAVMIFSFTMQKNYKVDVSTGQVVEVSSDDWSEMLSAYICTTEGIARPYDYYSMPERGGAVNLLTPVAGIIEKIPILRLPMTYPAVKKFITEHKPSWRLAQEGSEICPLAGEMLFYGSPVLGWILDIIAMILVMKLLITLEVRSKQDPNLANRYLSTWLSVTCGMIMSYNLGHVFYQFMYIPFFTWCALKINEKIRIRTTT